MHVPRRRYSHATKLDHNGVTKACSTSSIAVVLLATGFVMVAQSASYLWVRWLFRGGVPASNSGYPGAIEDKSSKRSLQKFTTVKCWDDGKADENAVDLLDVASIMKSKRLCT